MNSGLRNKTILLRPGGPDLSCFAVPTRGTAL